eukprot:c4385_g1_i1.p1 GENE.c4385_g1_i1~~c4385_g1_i1.p1  ORF type:complete len:612 (-),score=94.85 c4385_g1_i1:14-1777(-)
MPIAAEREVAEEFAEGLTELRTNDFYAIRNLTTIAKENCRFAPVIVNEIEKATLRAIPSNKLVYLYVMDSIVKNVGSVYLSLFSDIAPNLFITTLETNASSQEILESLRKLFVTWGSVFPPNVLDTIRAVLDRYPSRHYANRSRAAPPRPLPPSDRRLERFDSRTPPPAPPSQQHHYYEDTRRRAPRPIDSRENDIRRPHYLENDRLVHRHMEPREPPHTRYEHSIPRSNPYDMAEPRRSYDAPTQYPQHPVYPPEPRQPHVIPQRVEPTPFPPVSSISAPPIPIHNMNFVPNYSIPTVAPLVPPPMSAPPPPMPVVPVVAPVVPLPLPVAAPRVYPTPPPQPPSRGYGGSVTIGEITTILQSMQLENTTTLKQFFPQLLGIVCPKNSRQCTTCGMRFTSSHELANHTEKHSKLVVSPDQDPPSREWFTKSSLWIEGVTSTPSVSGESSIPSETPNFSGDVSVPANDEKSMCAVCGEGFDKFWSDDADDWRFKGVVECDGEYLHIKCTGGSEVTAGPAVSDKLVQSKAEPVHSSSSFTSLPSNAWHLQDDTKTDTTDRPSEIKQTVHIKGEESIDSDDEAKRKRPRY